MTPIRRAFSAAAVAVASFSFRFAARANQGFSFLLGRTNIDYARSMGDPTKNSIVVAVVGWIARNFPDAPVQISFQKGDGDVEYVKPGPIGPGRVLQLLERPNPWFSGVLLWIATVVEFYTRGNAYWLKVRNQAGRVEQLWWVPTSMIRPAWPDDGKTFIGWYEYRVDGEVYKIDPVNVVHFRDGIDPANPRLGLSKLAALVREIYTDDEAANFTATMLTNLGVPGVVIAPANTTPGAKADPEQVKKSFMEKFGGDKRGEPMILTTPTDVKVLSFNPQQMELRELRKIPEERVSAVLGVSAIVAGLGAGLDRSTFTNFGEARAAGYEEAVIPLQRLLAADLEVQLLDDFVDLDSAIWDVSFDLSKVRALAPLFEALWKRLESSATKGLITRAAFLKGVGLKVAKDGSDDVFIYPNNYTLAPVSAGGNTPGGLTPQVRPAQGPPALGPGQTGALEPGTILVAGRNGHGAIPEGVQS